ncbi:MAG: DUF4365 domain-containing protein [Bryobacteraceae bacterium]
MELRPKSSRKLLNPNQPTEDLGLMFIHKIAHQMGAIWRRTPNDDYGLDGELELTSSSEVTGSIIKVQLKAGASYFRNRTQAGFSFYIDPSDANYWPKVTCPVILVVYDPENDAGYWIDIKRYLAEHSGDPAPSAIRFSYARNAFTQNSLLGLSEIAIPDEGDRTEFLVDKIRETLHANMLPVIGLPHAVYEAELSLKRLADADEGSAFAAKAFGGTYRGFRDPMEPGFRLRGYIDSSTVREIKYPEYLKLSGSRTFAVGRWNSAVRDLLLQRGLLAKDAATFYFPPNADRTPRSLIWESTRGRTPERQVAYPYIGKLSGAVAFWVHHACRIAFCEVGDHFFLRLTPAYVFTRDGMELIADREAGALSTSRKSKDRNYQVFNHLMFWLWFLREGGDSITLAVDGAEVIVSSTFMTGEAGFGIPADKKSLIEIVAAEHDVDWTELEADAGNEEIEDE